MNPTSFNEQHEGTTPRDHGVHRSESARSADPRVPRRRKIDIARALEIGRNLGVQIEDQAKKRPFVIVGAAIGVGFVGGSLLGSRLGQMVLAAAIGYGLRNAVGGPTDPIRTGLGRLAGEVGAD